MTERRLVRDLMTVGVVTCTPDTPVPELARQVLESDLEGVIVLDHEGHAVGTVTQHELVGAYLHDDPRALTAEEYPLDGSGATHARSGGARGLLDA